MDSKMPIGCEVLACDAPVYERAYAAKVVQLLMQQETDNWKYQCEELPTGKARIMVFDNDGSQLGWL